MLKIIKPKGTDQIKVASGSKQKENGDNLNNVRREASRHFRNKKREYLKDKINELEGIVRIRTLIKEGPPTEK
jgi:hypothetical protein